VNDVGKGGEIMIRNGDIIETRTPGLDHNFKARDMWSHWSGRARGGSLDAVGAIAATNRDDERQTISIARRQPRHIVALITPG
jgi:hypothetical protein